MIDNKKTTHLGTANFARPVYFLATLILGAWLGVGPSTAQAQSIDMNQLAKWQYKGESRDIHKGLKCEFFPLELQRNDRGQFEQDFRFLVLPKKPQDPPIRLRMRATHQLRVKFPAGCDRESKLCLYDFNLIQLNDDGSVPRKPESFSIEILSPDEKPYELRGIRVYFKGGTTGAKRLYWDCDELTQEELP